MSKDPLGLVPPVGLAPTLEVVAEAAEEGIRKGIESPQRPRAITAAILVTAFTTAGRAALAIRGPRAELQEESVAHGLGHPVHVG